MLRSLRGPVLLYVGPVQNTTQPPVKADPAHSSCRRATTTHPPAPPPRAGFEGGLRSCSRRLSGRVGWGAPLTPRDDKPAPTPPPPHNRTKRPRDVSSLGWRGHELSCPTGLNATPNTRWWCFPPSVARAVPSRSLVEGWRAGLPSDRVDAHGRHHRVQRRDRLALVARRRRNAMADAHVPRGSDRPPTSRSAPALGGAPRPT